MSSCSCSSGSNTYVGNTATVSSQCTSSCLDPSAIGIIVGAVILGLILVLLILGFFITYEKRKKKKKTMDLLNKNAQKSTIDALAIANEIFEEKRKVNERPPQLPDPDLEMYIDKQNQLTWNKNKSYKPNKFPSKAQIDLNPIYPQDEEDQENTIDDSAVYTNSRATPTSLSKVDAESVSGQASLPTWREQMRSPEPNVLAENGANTDRPYHVNDMEARRTVSPQGKLISNSSPANDTTLKIENLE